jgi:D-alanyl-D-alanine carboxypeptidase
MAAFSNPALRARSLPPRAPLQPVAVWIGRNPAEGQQILDAQEAQQKAAAANSRAAKLEAAKAKRLAALEAAKQAHAERAERAQAAKEAAKQAAKSAPKPAAKVAAKPAHALPRSASAYTAATTPSMPEAKPGKGLSKPAPKTVAHKPAPARKPADKKASAEE